MKLWGIFKQQISFPEVVPGLQQLKGLGLVGSERIQSDSSVNPAAAPIFLRMFTNIPQVFLGL